MQIRPMTLNDCPQVAEIEAASFSRPWSLDAFKNTVIMPNYRYLVVEEDQEILGFCALIFVMDEGEIPNVCVKESARGKGIGRIMMEALIKEAEKLNLSVLYLEVRESNEPARRLYRSVGFFESGMRKNFYEQPQENAVLMSRTL